MSSECSRVRACLDMRACVRCVYGDNDVLMGARVSNRDKTMCLRFFLIVFIGDIGVGVVAGDGGVMTSLEF